MIKEKPFFTIDAETTVEDIKHQYKKLALMYHSDTGGNDADFNNLKEEYECYLRHLPIIKEFDTMFIHGKDFIQKISGFIVTVMSTNPSYGFIADLAAIYVNKKITEYDPAKLRMMFLAYLKTIKTN